MLIEDVIVAVRVVAHDCNKPIVPPPPILAGATPVAFSTAISEFSLCMSISKPSDILMPPSV